MVFHFHLWIRVCVCERSHFRLEIPTGKKSQQQRLNIENLIYGHSHR